MNRFTQSTTLGDIVRERDRDIADFEAVRLGKMDGRIRTATRAVPSAANNVVAGDAEGDVVVDGTYVYTLYSISGTLLWDRRSHSAGW